MDDAGNPAVQASEPGYVIDTVAPSSPSASPAAGTYAAGQSVTLTTNDGTATIRYTTNGVAPTCGTGTAYAGAISVGSSMTIKAIACDPAGNFSSVSTFVYIISGGGGGGGGGGLGSKSGIEPHGWAVIATTTAPVAPTSTVPVIEAPTPVGAEFIDPSDLSSLLNAFGHVCDTSLKDTMLTNAYADAKEFGITLDADQATAIRNYVMCGNSAASVAFGSGERRAIIRDYMDTVRRPGTRYGATSNASPRAGSRSSAT
jgi:hypothetical protein